MLRLISLPGAGVLAPNLGRVLAAQAIARGQRRCPGRRGSGGGANDQRARARERESERAWKLPEVEVQQTFELSAGHVRFHGPAENLQSFCLDWRGAGLNRCVREVALLFLRGLPSESSAAESERERSWPPSRRMLSRSSSLGVTRAGSYCAGARSATPSLTEVKAAVVYRSNNK